MSWPSFLQAGWGWMGLLALPLIALYLLRQKRPEVVVSSTLLWSKALADLRASTPFQKLRRNLLLLLQLLILAALVFALMRPVVRARASMAKAGVIVIDATASMQARDGNAAAAGQTRLERAKQEAEKLVDGMRPGDQYMLIADGGGLAQVRSGFTSNKSELKSLIASVEPSDTSTDLSESLLLAATSLRAKGAGDATHTEAVSPGQVWLFSDGSGVRVPDALGANASMLHFVKIGESDHSVGITQLGILPLPGEARRYQVFVGLKNAWPVERKVGVMLALNGKDNFLPGQAKFVVLPPNGEGSVVFEKVVSDPGKLFVRVDDTDDAFPLDNTAYGMLEPERRVRMTLVTAGNELLENFVKTVVHVGAADGAILQPSAYDPHADTDLVIFDGFVPPADKMPQADTLIIRPEVKGAGDVGGFHVTAAIDNPVILRWKGEDPLMQYVELSDLRISKALLLDKDPERVDVLSAPESPLISYKDFGSTRRYFVAFSPMLESNWYKLPSFLIFLQNVLAETRQRHYIGIPELLKAGQPARLWDVGGAAGDGPATITEPDGKTVRIQAKDNAVEFADTDKAGFYEVQAGKKTATFAVNVASPTESAIRPEMLQDPTGGNIQGASTVASVNKEVWQWAAAAALAVLLLEWWVYHRRLA